MRIGGLRLEKFCGPSRAVDGPAVAEAVRDAGYSIIQGKGYTSFGVATAIVRMCEAILRDEQAVLPVSTLLTGEFELADLCMSLPCVLGASGVERVLTPDLDPGEITVMQASAAALYQAWDVLQSG